MGRQKRPAGQVGPSVTEGGSHWALAELSHPRRTAALVAFALGSPLEKAGPELLNDRTFGKVFGHLLAFLDQTIECLGWADSIRIHQPAQGESGTAAAASLAVDVDRVALLVIAVDEGNPSANIGKRRGGKVDGWKMKLRDIRISVRLEWPGKFFAHVHDGADAEFSQPWHVRLERSSPNVKQRVDLIPPVPKPQHAANRDIPDEGRIEREPGKET
jgi:hypothetical protein